MSSQGDILHLRALSAIDASDGKADPRFQDIVDLAKQWFDVPMVSITLVDTDCQWRVAYEGPLTRTTPLTGAICPVAMHADETFVVMDATRDPRFSDSPYVKTAPRIRFYAAWPLKSPDGEPIGTFCVMDSRARTFNRTLQDQLAALGTWVESELHRDLSTPA